MGYFDAAFWSGYFRRVFISHVCAFEHAVIARLLPAFEGIEDEAQRIILEEYERLGRLPGDESVGMDDIAERAHGVGLAKHDESAAVRQSLLNLSAASLFHLFEQQLLVFHHRQVLAPSEERDHRLFRQQAVRDRLRAEGVDLEAFASWKGIKELEALANTVKHGGGRSANLLRTLRPELLVHPLLRDESRWTKRPRIDVNLPLAGDSVFVTETDIRRFAAYVVAFWNDLAEAISLAQHE